MLTICTCILLCSSVQQSPEECGPIGGLYGGPGGDYFDDGCDLGRILQVDVYASNFDGNIIVTAIETTYERGSTSHGLPDGQSPSGDPDLTVPVGDGESIVTVLGNAGDNNLEYVNKLGFIVMDRDGNTKLYGPVGEPYVGDNFVFCDEVTAFRGRSGWAIDSIGFNCY